MTGRDETGKCRRHAVRAGGLLLLGVALTAPLGAALPTPEEIAFRVTRDGEPLGRHTLNFRQESDGLHVEIDIALEVKFAFLTLFSYRHHNHEIWRDGRLVALETRTDDDGEMFWVRAQATNDGLRVENANGVYTAPSGIIPTSYWNAATVTQSQLLDTQTGAIRQVQVTPAAEESVILEGRPAMARKYRMSGDLEMDLWYSDSGSWAKLVFAARGAKVEYSRDGHARTSGETKAESLEVRSEAA